MRLSPSLLGLVSLVGTCVADGAAIAAALGVISADTISLNQTVASWPGDILGALPITVQSTTLLIDINKATGIAEDSAALNDTETLAIAVTTADLITDTNSTLTEIIAAKPKFDKLLLSPIIYLTLSSQKDASGKLSSAIAEKVPEAYQTVADALGAELAASFDVALDAYSFL
ncbi:hypothetical protein PFICI_15369 [Pestalotiopsis fici W106-1]|uniref:Antigenic cell wall galactomannoprotein n=1 Tax=Pestalotiopsis fici (strain W106-1 / CGMCC3.15140) TaxID=1229662 RepID=W3WIJ7_PESFW|nr:uncharacterized protein PFICI_15369 [Pestalotiopsis fici W106-1]ETS72977.1 hypothetical protein PFICI_15369 [Pestalotiopsis fici W106-1]